MNNKTLIPKTSIYQMLGALCLKPSLLNNAKMELHREYFGDLFYQVIFTSIQNMYLQNPLISKITATDIDNYVATNSKAKQIYDMNDGYRYMLSAIENANAGLFEYSFNMIKKCALLRTMQSNGFNIDCLNINDETLNQLEKIEIDEILDLYNLKILKLANEWGNNTRYSKCSAGDGIDELFESLSKEPDFGYPYFNQYYNSIFGGMKPEKLLIRSASSGVGKTRLALADLVSVACDEIYDIDKNAWKKNGKCHPATFIFTEGSKQELQICMLAIISGVPAHLITASTYTPDVYSRLQKAGEILKRTKVNFYSIEDFNISDIEQFIRNEVVESNVKYVFFDYIQMTPSLSKAVQEDYGLGLREDQIIANFSRRLKGLAEQYKIYISTATQLNRNSHDRSRRDASSLRGGSASLDKADIGIQVYDLDKNDLLEIQSLIEKTGITPNCVHIVNKNRGGIGNVHIYTVLDKSNVRERVAFVTDKNYNPITHIQPINIKFKGDYNVKGTEH